MIQHHQPDILKHFQNVIINIIGMYEAENKISDKEEVGLKRGILLQNVQEIQMEMEMEL